MSQVELRLIGILRDLARILVMNGYGLAGLNKIAKRAYFEAALELEAESGRRRNNARIAAATGLTRAEVSKFARPQELESSWHQKNPVNRAQRVSMAWVSTAKYTDKKGGPIVLPFTGRSPSFGSLVKESSGDIPAKAMLSEMLRLKMVKQVAGKFVRLVRVDTPVSRHTNTSLRALSPWIKFLSKGESGESSDLSANSIHVTLNFASLPQLFAAVREIQSRASAFVETVYELDSPGKSRKCHKLDVSFALGTRVRHHESNGRSLRTGPSQDRSTR